MLAGVTSVQLGSGLAATLFDEVGPLGTVLVRLGFAAAVLVALGRPGLRGHDREQLRIILLFGLTFAGMNGFFYLALDRLPLGVAVTFEFAGPLGVAVVASRRALDLVWVVLAAAGILLLSGGGSGSADATGIAFALIAGAFWAAYILLSAQAGQAFGGGEGLALAMAVGALVVVPAGIADGGSGLLDPGLLAMGAGVALLSSVIPYSLELEALRRIPARVFGVLMSLEPGVAALAGLVVLGQGLSTRQAFAIALVVAASAGAALSARSSAPVARD